MQVNKTEKRLLFLSILMCTEVSDIRADSRVNNNNKYTGIIQRIGSMQLVIQKQNAANINVYSCMGTI